MIDCTAHVASSFSILLFALETFQRIVIEAEEGSTDGTAIQSRFAGFVAVFAGKLLADFALDRDLPVRIGMLQADKVIAVALGELDVLHAVECFRLVSYRFLLRKAESAIVVSGLVAVWVIAGTTQRELDGSLFRFRSWRTAPASSTWFSPFPPNSSPLASVLVG